MRVLLVALLVLIAVAARAAAVDPALPKYEPRDVEIPEAAPYVAGDGAIVVVGYNDMLDLLQTLVADFTASHPDLHFRLDLHGTRFAPAALARDESAFAPMGAEFTPTQLANYRATVGDDPMEIRVAHASLDSHALSGPLAIFVHRDNPIASLTLEHLERIYTGTATRWGDLGLQGVWERRPISAYGVERNTPLALSFQSNAMHGRGFGERMIGFPQSSDVVRKVSDDRASIGFAAAMRATSGVRIVPITVRAGDPAIELTEENVQAGRYPLDRFLLVYARRPLNSVAREFLRLILSREGQEAVAATPQRYVPLSARDAAHERSKLD